VAGGGGGNEMKVTVVRYKVKADRAQENVDLISAVFAELKEKSPPGLSYASFKLDDGVSFLHIAAVGDGVESNPLPQMEAFKRFVADIKERCEEPPVATSASVIGAFNVFA
jgi:hypothetical protein